MSTINMVALHFGFGESANASIMIFQNQRHSFMSAYGALRHLAEFFLTKWKSKHVIPVQKKCCKKAIAKKTKFCSDCGQPTNKPNYNFDCEEYESWLTEQANHTADSWGSFESEWWPWTSLTTVVRNINEGRKAIEVPEYAEHWLIAALDPNTLPPGFSQPVAEWQSEFIAHHARNRLDNQKLDIEGLVKAEIEVLDKTTK